MPRATLQSEVVLSLAFVMLAATAVLAVLLLRDGEARLRDLVGRALLAEARAGAPSGTPVVPGVHWWRVGAEGAVAPHGVSEEAIDPATHELARSARREGNPLLQPGAPWDPIRFAAPVGTGGSVVVARLPRAASLRLRVAPLGVALVVLIVDVAIFTGFGLSLLRRRVVLPLQRLAAATRAIADGAFESRLPVEGPREAAEVARAFNEMTEVLGRRTRSLEKAVADLREANRTLSHARAGLARAERLAAVGRLAAGVAHEVGNPIAALLAFLDLIGRDPELAGPSRQHLARASEQGERVRRILRQLLEFSRPPQHTPRVPLDLRASAEETVALVSAQRRYRGVDFEVEAEPELPPALGEPGAVSQILLNLILNAADAVREVSQPRVRLCLRGAALRVRGDEQAPAASARRVPDAVECLVTDNGPGVAPEDRERVFDPFFTTKPPGEGTGLGLANSLRLAEELGGTLALAPAPPSGAAFLLRLPAVPDATDAARAGSARS